MHFPSAFHFYNAFLVIILRMFKKTELMRMRTGIWAIQWLHRHAPANSPSLNGRLCLTLPFFPLLTSCIVYNYYIYYY